MAETYAFLAQFETFLLSDPIMEIFGRTRSDLRRQGRVIPDLDLLIAATVVPHGLILRTRNVRRFARVPSVQVYASA